jgi:hypothetical protein
MVLASPGILFYVLRLRPMTPTPLPDPGIQTAYLVDPRDFLSRFSGALSAADIREAYRVGFIVPARVSYLLFGAVPGFFVLRYVFALIALVPAYVLFRRLYGRSSGALAIVIVMSCPVVITAWGTDYPDSAVVSYMTAAIACLAMPGGVRWRLVWLGLAGGFLTMAIWAHPMGVPLVAATLLAYAVVSVVRTRGRLLADGLVIAVSAAFVTAVLMLASSVLIGPWDYIVPTLKSYSELNQPLLVREYHSSNPRWILYRTYLLVPLAAGIAWIVTVSRRLDVVPTPQLIVGAAALAQMIVLGSMQFLGHWQTLEQSFYSSTLWGSVCLLLTIILTEIALPLFAHRLGRVFPVALLLAIPLLYEADPHVPALAWRPAGVCLAAGIVASAGVGRLLARVGHRLTSVALVACLVASAGCVLILTVAPSPPHTHLAGDAVGEPPPPYAGALGGSAGTRVDQYEVATELPEFVGNSTYRGEQLLVWLPRPRPALPEITGIYHSFINSLPTSPSRYTAADAQMLRRRRPAEVLVMDGSSLAYVLRALTPFRPGVLRTATLRAGDFSLRVWLISLGSYLRR